MRNTSEKQILAYNTAALSVASKQTETHTTLYIFYKTTCNANSGTETLFCFTLFFFNDQTYVVYVYPSIL